MLKNVKIDSKACILICVVIPLYHNYSKHFKHRKVMKVRTFNDKQGNRDRSCRYCIVHNGVAYSRKDAEEMKLAVFRELNYTKNGKWSNSDWEVTTKSATLVVAMSPFNYWPDDLESCLSHIMGYYGQDSIVTREDALIAFKFLYPDIYERIAGLENNISQLI